MLGCDPRAQLENRVSAAGESSSRGLYVGADSKDPRFAIDEYNIQRVAHAEGVDAGARRNQQSLGSIQRSADEQSESTGNERVGHPDLQKAAGSRALVVSHHHSPAFSNCMAIGKPMTRNVQGKMNAMRGKSIFTGASRAIFSARWNRSVRRCSA